MTPPPTNQPTNINMNTYLSIRVTLPHDEWSTLVSVLFEGSTDSYIGYPHIGRNGSNPHFHVLIPTERSRDAERFRNRLRRHFGASQGGNKGFAISYRTNGISAGIQYCSREGSEPILSTPALRDVVDSAPKWEARDKSVSSGMTKRPRETNPDHFKQITPRNLEKVTYNYWLDHQMKTDDLAEVLSAMHSDGWRLAESILRYGLLSIYYDQFKALTQKKTVFKATFFHRLKSTPGWAQF